MDPRGRRGYGRMVMRLVSSLPAVHFFVCKNRRPSDAPLGPGCGEAGEAIYRALKDEVARGGLFATVWVTETMCLGICPKRGATVAVYRAAHPAQSVITEVLTSDAAQLFADAT